MKNLSKIGLIAVLLLFVVLQLVMLKSLDYSTSSLSWYSIEDDLDAMPPTPNFVVGDIEFDVSTYNKASELEIFRKYFRKNCDSLKGIKAASCLSEHFLEKVPFGEPSNELFSSDYSPTENFQQHINGKPGHCVSYSGMTVTTLLSVGIPARMLQILPEEKDGHNLIEVWDEKVGWVIFDPLSDSLLAEGKTDKYLSAIEALSVGSNIRRVEAGKENINEGYLTDYYLGKTPFDQAITYPEPWLYTRIGNKESLIYRGSFVAIGEGFWKYKGLHILLKLGILTCFIGVLLLIFSLLRTFYIKVYRK